MDILTILILPIHEYRISYQLFVSSSISFIKVLIRGKEGYYSVIKVSIHQQDIAIVNIHALNIGASKYIK